MSRAEPAVLAARLCEALHSEEAPLVEALLKQGADPNLILPEGIAPIHLAAGKERESGVRCLKLILQYGGNPNARSVEELTPLHVAASWGCYKCLKLLLRHGGDPNLEDQDGNRAIDLALEEGNQMCVQTLQGFRHMYLPEEADGASEHIFCRNAESFFSTLTDDCTESSVAVTLSEDPGPLSSTQKCLPDGSPSNAGQGVTVNSAAAADASVQLRCIPGDLQDHPCHSLALSPLPFCVHSYPQCSQESGLLQPVLSSTQLLASLEPQEPASNLSLAQGLLEDAAAVCPSSETESSLAPTGPGCEDATESGLSPPARPAPCHDESISEKLLVSQLQRCHAALARRSVSFCGSPTIFPFHKDEDQKESPRAGNASETLDLSQLSDFLDLKMLVKVNGEEGLDVTSPDHAYLFCWANSTAISDLEKTVMGPTFLAGTPDSSDAPSAAGRTLSGSSESSSGRYGSCNSECYVSAAEASDHRESGGDGVRTCGEGPRCCSLSARDKSADSSGKGGSSQEHVAKQLIASCEELIEMPSAVEAAMQHLSVSGAPLAGGRCFCANFEASPVSRAGSGSAGPGKPALELCAHSAAQESLKDTGASRPGQEFPAECIPREQNDRGSNVLSTQEPHGLSLADLAVKEAGLEEAAPSGNCRQVKADWEAQSRVKGSLLSADSGPAPRPGGAGIREAARRADTVEGGLSAERSGVAALDMGLPGRAAGGVLDTGLPGRAVEDENNSPFNGGSVNPPSLSSEADTVVIQQPASPPEDTFSHSNEQQAMFHTQSSCSPLLQAPSGPCHVTPRTKSRLTSATRDSSCSSSSLFDTTLEIPRRPRRVRSPEGRPWTPAGPAASRGENAPGSSWVAGDNASGWEAEKSTGRDAAAMITKGSSSSGSSPGPSSYRDASPTVPLNAEGDSGAQASCINQGKVEPSAACNPSLPQPPSLDHAASGSTWLTEDGEADCTHPAGQVALAWPLGAPAFSQARLDAGRGERRGEVPSVCLSEEPRRDAKRQPGSSRVSFSRLSSRGPPGAAPATAHLSGQLSPVPDACSQDVPLSPGGRPAKLGAREPVEFLYTDEERGYTLVERHVPCTDDASVLADTTSSDDTIIYDWRAYQSRLAGQGSKENRPPTHESPVAPSQRQCLSDDALLRKLRELGANPGPVTSQTRKLYLQLLDQLMTEPSAQAKKRSAGHSPELAAVLETFQIPDCTADEMALSRQFDQPDKSRKWREGLLKSSFNYLLLDPRVTQNLPFRCHRLSQADCFQTFIRAVFYVGKGKRSRPYSHLYEALAHYRARKKQACAKVQHILEIWAGGQGVISMHCFQNTIPVEAYTREACMVDAIGLKMLTNQKKGNYYGVVASWPMRRRRCLGIHMLHRAMQIFLAEGERQLRPADLQIGQ